jgi:hypothetical protein
MLFIACDTVSANCLNCNRHRGKIDVPQSVGPLAKLTLFPHYCIAHAVVYFIAHSHRGGWHRGAPAESVTLLLRRDASPFCSNIVALSKDAWHRFQPQTPAGRRDGIKTTNRSQSSQREAKYCAKDNGRKNTIEPERASTTGCRGRRLRTTSNLRCSPVQTPPALSSRRSRP